MIYVGVFLVALGLTMWTRGMIYTLRPQGKIAEKRKRKNLKYGFTTDMKLFGRKIRRLGFMLTLFGSLALAWGLPGTEEADLDPSTASTLPSVEPAAKSATEAPLPGAAPIPNEAQKSDAGGAGG